MKYPSYSIRRAQLSKLAICCAVPLLVSCATASKGGHQTITVRVQNEAGEALSGVPCELSNRLGRWSLTAPGSVDVKRSADPLMIRCENDQWVMAGPLADPSQGSVGESAVKGAGAGAGVGAVVGALSPFAIMAGPLGILVGAAVGSIYGGVAGAAVDSSSGAAYEYAPGLAAVVKPRAANGRPVDAP